MLIRAPEDQAAPGLFLLRQLAEKGVNNDTESKKEAGKERSIWLLSDAYTSAGRPSCPGPFLHALRRIPALKAVASRQLAGVAYRAAAAASVVNETVPAAVLRGRSPPRV